MRGNPASELLPWTVKRQGSQSMGFSTRSENARSTVYLRFSANPRKLQGEAYLPLPPPPLRLSQSPAPVWKRTGADSAEASRSILVGDRESKTESKTESLDEKELKDWHDIAGTCADCLESSTI